MFCYTVSSSVLWLVIVIFVEIEGPSVGTKWKTTGCYLLSQNSIEITEVICPLPDVGCLISLPSSSDDVTALSETKIRYKCKNSRSWEQSTATNLTTTCQRDRWLPPISRCDQVITMPKSDPDWSNLTLWTPPVFTSKCGISTIKTDVSKPLVWRGNEVKLGEFPWHAGVYDSEGDKSRKPICGATIIASQYLLSAAHCFTETTNTAKMRNSTEFFIIVGKLQSRNDVTENSQQRHEITYIITTAYRGRSYRYQNDIAIIRTRTEITFSSKVSPICMINEYFPHIPENADLWVAGWGYFNGSRIQSENLMSIKLPYISYDQCSANPNYEQLSTFLTAEKFCTLREGSMEVSLDEGDSGGGLVTKGPNNAYYLIGVVSLSQEGSPIVMCTYVPHFHKWIFETTLDHYIYLNTREQLTDGKNSPKNGTASTKSKNTGAVVFTGNRGKPIVAVASKEPPKNKIVKLNKTECGKSVPNVTPLIRGGGNARFGEFPWNVAIYSKSEELLLCGGTIISPYVAVSAAHCLYDSQKEAMRSAGDFVIAVGKVTRDFNVIDSEVTAFYEIERIIAENFAGHVLHFRNDIAILQIKSKIVFNTLVTPICLHQSSFTITRPGDILHANGWGYDETEKPSPVLKAIDMLYLNRNQCLNEVQDHTKEYISIDKFCMKEVNGSSIEKGDSGGGVSIVDQTTRLHYLVGIVSVKLFNLQDIILGTDVTQYDKAEWIRKIMNEIDSMKP